MLIGDPHSFAIESVITDRTSDGWIFGHIRFWAAGQTIGDWDDCTALNSCLSWLRAFADDPIVRSATDVADCANEDVFRALFDPVMVGDAGTRDQVLHADDLYHRFHIAYLGMSAFDAFDLLLLETTHQQRLLWRSTSDTTIRDVWFPPRTMQDVARQYCQQFAP